jgi:hypothetical protein
MVMRKPLTPAAAANVAPNVADGLNTITASADVPPAFRERSPSRKHPYDVENWQEAGTAEGLESMPQSLRSKDGRRSTEGSQDGGEDIPESLRAGPPGYTPRSSEEMQRPAESTNPYIRRQQSGQSTPMEVDDTCATAWGDSGSRPPPPTNAPPPPPIPKGEHIFRHSHFIIMKMSGRTTY